MTLTSMPVLSHIFSKELCQWINSGRIDFQGLLQQLSSSVKVCLSIHSPFVFFFLLSCAPFQEAGSKGFLVVTCKQTVNVHIHTHLRALSSHHHHHHQQQQQQQINTDPELLKVSFQAFDEDRNGKITPAEIRCVRRA